MKGYILSTAFGIVSIVALVLFFTVNDPMRSNEFFVVGFLFLCGSFILIPTKPNKFANKKGFRVKYYKWATK